VAPRPIGWRRVGLEALLVGAVAGLALLWRHDRIARGWIGFGTCAALFVVAYTELRRTGRDRLANIVTVVVIVGYFGMGQLFRGSQFLRTKNERLAAVALIEGPGHRLFHPTLGFSIRDPGPDLRPALVASVNPATIAYQYTNAAQDVTLTVGVFRGRGDPETVLREMLKNGDEGAPPLTPPFDLTKVEVVGDVATIEGRVGASHLRARGYSFSRDGAPYTCWLAVFARAPDPLEDVLTSFER
jgi:hypothetical protein